MTITDTSQYHSKDIMEFVTVGFEFCKRIENVNSTKRKDFIELHAKNSTSLICKISNCPEFSN